MANNDDVICVAKGIGIHEFIMSLPMGYDTVVGDRGTCLSGGQKQCISIARALLKKSSVLILDEATASLDIESERRIMEYIDNIEGLTKIIVTHRLNSIIGCDQVIVLKNGCLIESGDSRELATSTGYFSAFINIKI